MTWIRGVAPGQGVGRLPGAYQIGDSSMDIQLPTWPAKFTVPLALSVLWLRLVLQICGYVRMVRHPDAEPVAVPKLITIETQVKDEIAEALGRGDAR